MPVGDNPIASNPLVIPHGERFGNLKPILFEYVDIVAKLRDANTNLASQQPSFFLFLAFPWVADKTLLSSEQVGFLERRKKEITQLGFDGDRAKKHLDEVIANDKHLAECCPTPYLLAKYFDSSFITAVADAKRQKAASDRLEFAFEEFESLTYHQGHFRRIALSHLFNFDMDTNSAKFVGDERTVGSIQIERIDLSTIPRILGEAGFQAFLHPSRAGNCFVVEDESASSVPDFQWLSAKREKAYYFAEVLQYFKDGVVHLGYSAPFFQPNWAQQIRQVGLYFMGSPRLSAYEGGNKPYVVSEADRSQFAKWWNAATKPELAKAFANRKGKLRQATYRAARYYEASHERSELVERLIAVAIGVEALFSPSDQSELSFRISQSTAQFVGADSAERQVIFDSMKDMYNRRSKLVHGTYDVEKYDKGEFVTADEIDRWSGYLRRAYLGFMTLYLRAHLGGKGEESRESVLERIAKANFDSAIGEKLREDANINHLLDELST
jgi:hypothetical protein